MNRNNIVASESSGSLLYNSLEFKFIASLTKLAVWLLEQSDEVTTSVCSLRNTELTATNAGYNQNSTGNAHLP